MAVLKIARFAVRPDACDQAEHAMRGFADYVRRELPDSSWSTYRDPHAAGHYISLSRAADTAADDRHRDAPGTKVFTAALVPLLDGALVITECDLVTSSDLQRRLPDRAARGRRRPARR